MTAAAAAVLLPIAGALVAIVRPRVAACAGLTAAAGTLLACLAVAVHVHRDGLQRHGVGGWDAPLGIMLHADGLSAAMLAATALAGAVVSLYAHVYYRGGESAHARPFWPAWLLLWGALNGLYLSSDVFNLYVLLELVGLSAVALLVNTGGREAWLAGMRYLLAALMGSMGYLFGVALLYGSYGTLDLYQLGQVIEPGAAASTAMALMTAGLVLKTALFPLHFWLPAAHAAASTPVSAILSALVVKASFYLVLRLWFETFLPVQTAMAAQTIGALGAAAILWGSYRAIRQRRLKLLIAHSTVGQIGYLFLVLPLAVSPTAALEPWTADAWAGGCYQMLSHTFAKAAMFLCAGVVLRAMASDDLYAMKDVASRLPIASLALAIAGASLIGLPPTGGFTAKWLLMHAAIESGQWWWVPVLVLGTLLTSAYVFLIVRFTFRPGKRGGDIAPVAPVLQWCALGLASVSAALGMRLEEPLELLGVGMPWPLWMRDAP